MSNLSLNESVDMELDMEVDMEIDELCTKMSNSEIYYDERQEVFDSLNLKFAGKSDLIKAEERYKRYLKDVEVWYVYEICFEHVREDILKFINIKTNEENLLIKLKMMRKIDRHIKHIIELVE